MRQFVWMSAGLSALLLLLVGTWYTLTYSRILSEVRPLNYTGKGRSGTLTIMKNFWEERMWEKMHIIEDHGSSYYESIKEGPCDSVTFYGHWTFRERSSPNGSWKITSIWYLNGREIPEREWIKKRAGPFWWHNTR